ncbi:hypothetical protein [Bradyrhizobium sp. SSUT77]|uniref:hypothetical protein n=1 Tax=Bradyrhizobium sp. SSUT77 TaxID=3040603 RepID=UPI00244D4200|nr:hypothetical protein [Bradyrhizobium sp. SSUT77]MDH2347775.1 hypothetical protein [Bradyrhizobium sp. SSUT77]
MTRPTGKSDLTSVFRIINRPTAVDKDQEPATAEAFERIVRFSLNWHARDLFYDQLAVIIRMDRYWQRHRHRLCAVVLDAGHPFYVISVIAPPAIIAGLLARP